MVAKGIWCVLMFGAAFAAAPALALDPTATSPASAAPAVPAAPTAPAAPPAMATIAVPTGPTAMVLRQGTAVRLKTNDALDSGKAKLGDRFELTTAEPVSVGSLLVIPAGSRAVGEVTRASSRGLFGASGKLETRILYVTVGDQRISLAGTARDQGSNGTAGVVAAALVFWPVMPFITGKNATLPAGSYMTGYVENDIQLAVSQVTAPPVQVLTVPAPAASAPIPAASPALPPAPATPLSAGIVKTSAPAAAEPK